MTNKIKFFKVYVLITLLTLSIFSISANAGINHDMDKDLSDGAELDVDDNAGNDVADLSIPANIYNGRASLVAVVIPNPHPDQTLEPTANFWWNLHTQGTENWSGIIVLHYDENELNGISEDELVLYHYDGNEWVNLGGVVDEAANTITAEVYRDDFSPYALSRSTTPGATSTGTIKQSDKVRTLGQVPAEVSLSNYPNPFNPETTISFALNKSGNVTLAIYDIYGRLIKSFINEEMYSEGEYSVVWNGTNENNESVESGSYIYLLKTDSTTSMKMMTLLK